MAGACCHKLPAAGNEYGCDSGSEAQIRLNGMKPNVYRERTDSTHRNHRVLAANVGLSKLSPTLYLAIGSGEPPLPGAEAAWAQP